MILCNTQQSATRTDVYTSGNNDAFNPLQVREEPPQQSGGLGGGSEPPQPHLRVQVVPVAQQLRYSSHVLRCLVRRRAIPKPFSFSQSLRVLFQHRCCLSRRRQRLWEPQHFFQLQRDLHQLLRHQTLTRETSSMWNIAGNPKADGRIDRRALITQNVHVRVQQKAT